MRINNDFSSLNGLFHSQSKRKKGKPRPAPTKHAWNRLAFKLDGRINRPITGPTSIGSATRKRTRKKEEKPFSNDNTRANDYGQ